jgi:hypothetical protein
MASDGIVMRHLNKDITTFTTKFNRFAPFGLRKFIAVGNRATAIRLSSKEVVLLNPIQLTPSIKHALNDLGGVHYIACDLGHHMYIKDYLQEWPEAKAIGVKGLETKRKDVAWDYIYDTQDLDGETPEVVFGWETEIETLCFSGFITRAVAWHHKPTGTMITSDHLMNLPCTEQYAASSSSASQGPGSWAFSKLAHPHSLFFRSLIYFVATTDYVSVRRDAKKVAEWKVKRLIPCHGDVIEHGGSAAWEACYTWFLHGPARAGILRRGWDSWMSIMRRVGLGAW